MCFDAKILKQSRDLPIGSVMKRLVLCALVVSSITACEDLTKNPYAATPAPDYRIKLTQDPYGRLQAVPPDCPEWRTNPMGPLQNEPWPQYGCANTRNLAAMVEKPEDLVQGRDMGLGSGEIAASSVRRYYDGKTRDLIDPNAKAPSQGQANSAPTDQGGNGQGGTTK